MSLSPASSASCHQPPPLVTTETSAHSCLPVSPTEWSTEEVSHFIASLQGETVFPVLRSGWTVSAISLLMFSAVSLRLWGACLPVPVPGDRRAGSAPAKGGAPHVHYEHQARSRPQDLRPHQQSEGLMSSFLCCVQLHAWVITHHNPKTGSRAIECKVFSPFPHFTHDCRTWICHSSILVVIAL